MHDISVGLETNNSNYQQAMFAFFHKPSARVARMLCRGGVVSPVLQRCASVWEELGDAGGVEAMLAADQT